MKIIATTETGFLIEATQNEVKGIISATLADPKTKIEPTVGTKLPAHDYAAVISSCKSFKKSYEYEELKRKMELLQSKFKTITDAVDKLNFNND
jgi:hypothetical protein